MQDDRDSCCSNPNPIADKNPDQLGLAGAARNRPTEEDDCCDPKHATPGCGKGCCSAPTPPRPDDTPVPSCCEGKAAPCCDESCLDRLALRECEKYGPGLTAHGSTASACGRGKDGKPCVNHANKTRLAVLLPASAPFVHWEQHSPPAQGDTVALPHLYRLLLRCQRRRCSRLLREEATAL
ncbi:01aa111b-11b9-4dad-8335-2b0e810ac5af [Thermothielavioides terrestris]|uniref:01aa111b-11b9-4dad-8335-2b0e810ac5af n=1 Tax=Thermothielavioides terrestris TaxID=2587410 RepID=A0A446B9W4_9PEZI|nr:01aa111b-11b9-4dad-8335-2b0e810ac5af [Thermothielavioides terrestris]